MLLKKTDFDGNGISAEEMEVYLHTNSNLIEIAFFKDNHYVDGIHIPAPETSAPMAEQEDATALDTVACSVLVQVQLGAPIFSRRTRLRRMKQDDGMRVVELNIQSIETGQVQSPDQDAEVNEVGLGLTYGKHKDISQK